jgi:hypothetical protein
MLGHESASAMWYIVGYRLIKSSGNMDYEYPGSASCRDQNSRLAAYFAPALRPLK